MSGEPLPPDWALQDPAGLRRIDGAQPCAGRSPTPASTPAQVIGIGTDFTSCTMVPTLADGTPLSELAEFKDRPHAYVKLWKHHAAQPQADRINELAAARAASRGSPATAG